MREEPDSGRVAALRRDIRNLDHLTTFALPLIEQLAGWPVRASWGEWLGRFSDLAARALRQPTRVLQLLAELRPMAEVTDVTSMRRARAHDRLAPLDRDPPGRRYGRLFVGTPQQARGRRFRVVFVPAWPSASCRSVLARIRCCSTNGAEVCHRSHGWCVRTTGPRRAAAAEDLRSGRRPSACTLSYPRLDGAAEDGPACRPSTRST